MTNSTARRRRTAPAAATEQATGIRTRIQQADIPGEAAGTARRGTAELPEADRADIRVAGATDIPGAADSGRTLRDRPMQAAPVVGKSPGKASNECVCWTRYVQDRRRCVRSGRDTGH